MLQSCATPISQTLYPGEHLLWSEQPRGGIRLRGQDGYLIPFSLLWGGFAIFWECMAHTLTSKGAGPLGLIFPLFGLPFVSVGLYLIFGRFIAVARNRSRAFYGVTNERIIIISGLFSQQTKSLQLRSLADVSLTQRNDRSGTITSGPTPMMNNFFPAGSWPGTGHYAATSFGLIDRAKNVCGIVRNAQRTTATDVSKSL